jgi:hypothetical protein
MFERNGSFLIKHRLKPGNCIPERITNINDLPRLLAILLLLKMFKIGKRRKAFLTSIENYHRACVKMTLTVMQSCHYDILLYLNKRLIFRIFVFEHYGACNFG